MTDQNIVCIIQARMGSVRLPGKVLLEICNHSVLWHVLNRVSRSRYLNQILVATSELPGDDVIAKKCREWGQQFFRGSEQDVLDRYFQAAQAVNATIIVRITADCPLIDPEIMSKMIEKFNHEKIDYLSNVVEPRTYPKGFDTEIFTMSALRQAAKEAKNTYDREHVTPFIRNNPDKFRVQPFFNDHDLSRFNFSLDTLDDLKIISAIYYELFPINPEFTSEDIFRTKTFLNL